VTVLLENPEIQSPRLRLQGCVLNHIYCLHSMGKLREIFPTLPPIYSEPPEPMAGSYRSPMREWYDEMMKDVTIKDTPKTWWKFW
jgi:hypothetical protein